jgi:hypothetical protein
MNPSLVLVLMGALSLDAAAGPAAPSPSTGPHAEEEADFASDARLLFRIAACSGSEPLPRSIDPAVVRAHCDWLVPRMERYRRLYVGVAKPYLAKLRPAWAPPTVVYPFGGGDLLSALTSYPDAAEITTISLEHGGDPRRVRTLTTAELAKGLELLRHTIRQLLTLDDSASTDLMKAERGGVPGQLAFFLVGLAIHGQEPVSLRYFRLGPAGQVHYLTVGDIAASEARRAHRLDGIWNDPDFSEAFSNLEIGFRPKGAKDAPVHVHRHIAANLGDRALTEYPGLLRHLEAKGKVSAMVKAASYLLWMKGFTKIRGYLLTHTDFMFSDTTGIPPRYAARAGFVQDTYGSFAGTFMRDFQGPAYRREIKAFVDLWRSQPHREIAFRYGYPDVNRRGHLLVTRRLQPTAP